MVAERRRGLLAAEEAADLEHWHHLVDEARPAETAP